MKVLLDTQALIWVATESPKLSHAAKDVLGDTENTPFISAASAWEIATKVRLGKLPEAITLEANFVATLVRNGYTMLSITVEDALRAGRLPIIHRDPFDRMIAAQALALDIPVISNDAKLELFGVRRLW